MSDLACGCKVTDNKNVVFCRTHRAATDFEAFIRRHLHLFPAIVADEARTLLSGEVKVSAPETIQRGCGCKVTWENNKIISASYCEQHEKDITEKVSVRIPTLHKSQVEGMRLEKEKFEDG